MLFKVYFIRILSAWGRINISGTQLIKFLFPALSACLLSAFYIHTQSIIPINDGLVLDATVYHSISSQIINASYPLKGVEPFVYRLGTPYLAAMLFPENLIQGYLIVNIVFAFASMLLFYFFLRIYINQQFVIYFFLIAYIINPLGVLRFTLFYPVYTDPGALFFSMLILYISLCFTKVNWATTLLLSLLSFIGIFFREIVVLAPLSILLSYLLIQLGNKKQLLDSELLHKIIPLAFSIAGFIILRHSVEATPTDYSFYSTIIMYLKINFQDPIRYITAVLMTIGPIALLPLVLYRYRVFSSKQLVLIIYLSGVFALAFIGGWHLDRIVSWGAFAYLTLIALFVANFIATSSSLLLKFLVLISVVIAQLIAHRFFLPIPDINDLAELVSSDNVQLLLFTPYGDKISALYTYSASIPGALRLKIVLQYALFLSYLVLLTQLFYYYKKNYTQKNQ